MDYLSICVFFNTEEASDHEYIIFYIYIFKFYSFFFNVYIYNSFELTSV